MATKRFLIAPLQNGLQTNVRPWLIPDDAYAQLNNMYVFRGRLRKRFGSQLIENDQAYDAETAQLYSRLRVNLGTTNAITGNFTSATPCVSGITFKVGQLFSIGDTIFTVVDDTPGNQAVLTTGSATATFDVSTGLFVVTGNTENPSTDVFFYPAEPVTGIIQNETANINDEPTYAFDTRFAYQYINGGWSRLGTAVWQGDSADLFWGTTARGSSAATTVFFASNFNWDNASYATSDPIRYVTSGTWTDFTPKFATSVVGPPAIDYTIFTARIIVEFKDRLLLLNVVEEVNEAGSPTLTQYGNRCRFSQNGDPTDQTNGWLQDVGGRGGYIDAPTQEQILSAEFLKDRLIVFFERSTWELVYTGNEILPFVWQKINTELGVESTFSVVPFDQAVIGVGNVGIHECTGTAVNRIDDKIPDYVFQFINTNGGVERIVGIRDYKVEHVYWSFLEEDSGSYPNKVLIYDYRNGNWAINDDSITAFGYFQNQYDRTWESSPEKWEECDFTWSSGTLNALHRTVLAGNQQGIVFTIDPDLESNAPALSITNISGSTLTVIDHNLEVGDYILIATANGISGLPDDQIVQVETVDDSNTITIDVTTTGTYTGAGTIARVSVPLILTKQYNFFNDIGTNMSVNRVDILVDSVAQDEDTGESAGVTVTAYASSSNTPIESYVLETSPYSSDYYPLEESQTRLWHTIYPNINGETCQFQITLSDEQMRSAYKTEAAIVIHAMLFHVSTTSSRFE